MKTTAIPVGIVKFVIGRYCHSALLPKSSGIVLGCTCGERNAEKQPQLVLLKGSEKPEGVVAESRQFAKILRSWLLEREDFRFRMGGSASDFLSCGQDFTRFHQKLKLISIVRIENKQI